MHWAEKCIGERKRLLNENVIDQFNILFVEKDINLNTIYNNLNVLSITS